MQNGYLLYSLEECVEVSLPLWGNDLIGFYILSRYILSRYSE